MTSTLFMTSTCALCVRTHNTHPTHVLPSRKRSPGHSLMLTVVIKYMNRELLFDCQKKFPMKIVLEWDYHKRHLAPKVPDNTINQRKWENRDSDMDLQKKLTHEPITIIRVLEEVDTFGPKVKQFWVILRKQTSKYVSKQMI